MFSGYRYGTQAERLIFFLEANEVTEAIQNHIMGPETFHIIHFLVSPSKSSDWSFEEMAFLKNYF